MCVCVLVSSALYSSTNNGVNWSIFFLLLSSSSLLLHATFASQMHVLSAFATLLLVPIAIIERVAAFLY